MMRLLRMLAFGLIGMLSAGQAQAQPVIFDVSTPVDIGKDERLEDAMYADDKYVYYTATLGKKDDMLHVRRLTLSTLVLEDIYAVPRFTFAGSEVVPLEGMDYTVDAEAGKITFFATAVSKATRRLQLYGQIRTLAGKVEQEWKLIGEANYRAEKRSKIRYSVSQLEEGNYTAYFFAEEADTMSFYTMEVSPNLEAHPSKKMSLGFDQDDFNLLGLRRYKGKLYCYVRSAERWRKKEPKRMLLRVDPEKAGAVPERLELNDPGMELTDNSHVWDMPRGRLVLAGGIWNRDTKCTDGIYTQIIDLEKFAIRSLDKHPFTYEEATRTSLPLQKEIENVTAGQFPGFRIQRVGIVGDGEIQLEYFSMSMFVVQNTVYYEIRGINLARFSKDGAFRWIVGLPRHLPLTVVPQYASYISTFKDGKGYVIYWGHAVDMESDFVGKIHSEDTRWTMMASVIDAGGHEETEALFALKDRPELHSWRYALAIAMRINPTEYIFYEYPTKSSLQFARIKLK